MVSMRVMVPMRVMVSTFKVAKGVNHSLVHKCALDYGGRCAMTEIPICEHEGYSIVLRMPEGVFDATVDDSHVVSKSLSDLQERLTVLNTKLRQKKRYAVKCVSIFMMYDVPGKPSVFELRGVLGIVAGRSYSRALRTTQGQVEMSSNLIGLLPGDRRISVVKKLVREHNDAVAVFVRTENALQTYLKELPHVAVPSAVSKEDAIDKELLFLEVLRNIPVERD